MNISQNSIVAAWKNRQRDCIESLLFSAFSKEKDLYHILRTGEPITLEGVIGKDVIERRIEQLFEFEFKGWDISYIEEHEICKIEDMERLIQDASLFIKKVFVDDCYLFAE